MDALTLLSEAATNADTGLTQVFKPVTAEQAIWRLAGSTANPIGVTFLHAPIVPATEQIAISVK